MEGSSKRRMELPEEVISDILLKLPVKSLIRFRCVCKPWCSSFQTSYFISKFHQNNLKTNKLNLLVKLLNADNHDGVQYFSALSTQNGGNFSVKEDILFFFDNCRSEPVVHGPCNGLLCLEDELNDKVALWNPSTREFKILPLRPPPVHLISLGFGFDSTTDDYKVVRFVSNYFLVKNDEEDDIESHQAELYSLKSDSWKEISPPRTRVYSSPFFNNYINGFYYWVATGRSGDYILSFNMADEKFSNLPLPKFGGSLAQYFLELLDFNGLLGAIVYPRNGTEKRCDLWVMNGRSWTKEFNIGVEMPLGFWKNGELFLESSNNELVLFNRATGEVKNLGDAYGDIGQLIVYVESLVPIYGMSEHEEFIIRQPPCENASNRD